jgi:hypothetical protein
MSGMQPARNGRSSVFAVVAVVGVVAALLVWSAFDGDGAAHTRNDGASPDVAAHESERDAPGTELELAAAFVARGAAARRALTDSSADAIGTTFGDLVRVVDVDTSAPIEGASVHVWNKSGTGRAVAFADPVRVEDLNGVWVVGAPGHCSSWIATFGVEHALVDGPRPIELALARTGTLRVDFDDARVRDFPVESFAVSSQRPRDEARGGFRAGVGRALRTLASDDPSAAAAQEAVLELSRAWILDVPWPDDVEERDVAAALANGLMRDIGVRAARWVSLAGPIEADLEIEMLAGEPHVAHLGGDGTWSFRYPWNPPDLADTRPGSVQSEPFVIAAGNVHVIAPRHLALALVTARVPEGARDFTARLTHFERTEDSSRQRWCEAQHEGDVFEWRGLHPGDYEFEATWTGADKVHNHVLIAMQIASGEQRDLGTLDGAPGLQLTIVPRFVRSTGEPLGRDDFDPKSIVVTASATRRTGSTDGMGAEFETRSFEFTHGEPVRLIGLEPGRYTIATGQIGVAERPTFDGGDFIQWEGPPDINDLRIVRAEAPFEIDVDSWTTIDHEVRLEQLRELVLRLETSPIIDGDFLVLQAWIAGPQGLRGTPETLMVAHDGGSKIEVPWRLALPSGAWSLFLTGDTSLGGAATEHELVARCDVTIGAKSATERVTLIAAASLSLDPSLRDRLLELPGFGDFQPPHARTTAADGRLLIEGLVPDTEFRIGERLVRTGPPGSVVELR